MLIRSDGYHDLATRCDFTDQLSRLEGRLQSIANVDEELSKTITVALTKEGLLPSLLLKQMKAFQTVPEKFGRKIARSYEVIHSVFSRMKQGSSLPKHSPPSPLSEERSQIFRKGCER